LLVAVALALALAAVGGAALAVMARHKGRRDGDEVLGELGRAVGVVENVVRVLVHHEPRASLAEQVLHELNAEAAEAVPVGDHNLLDQAAVDAVQNGEKALALEVEAAADVGDELVPGVLAAATWRGPPPPSCMRGSGRGAPRAGRLVG